MRLPLAVTAVWRERICRQKPERCTGGTADVGLEGWQNEVRQVGTGLMRHTKEFGCYAAGDEESCGVLRRD